LTSAPEISVIVPAYQEGRRIRANLRRLLAEMEQMGMAYEVVVVSDGSTDDTVAEARAVGSPLVTVLSYPCNKGKGHALSVGVRQATGDLITFIDADMELNPREISAFVDLLKQGDHDVVVGSKRHPLSRVQYPAFRRLQSIAYQLLVRGLFRLQVRDTQTGLKLFRREVLSRAVPLLAVKRFAFDLELLVVAQHIGYRKITEAPIELSFQFESSIRLSSAFHVLWDTAAIFYRLHFLRHYDRRLAEASALRPAPTQEPSVEGAPAPLRNRGPGR
jgi:glycosyltransferase involved in cell wall biosynthesis